MASIAPLLTKVVELKRLHSKDKIQPPKYIITNVFTLQKLAIEAKSVGQLSIPTTDDMIIANLDVTVKVQDKSSNIFLEVA